MDRLEAAAKAAESAFCEFTANRPDNEHWLFVTRAAIKAYCKDAVVVEVGGGVRRVVVDAEAYIAAEAEVKQLREELRLTTAARDQICREADKNAAELVRLRECQHPDVAVTLYCLTAGQCLSRCRLCGAIRLSRYSQEAGRVLYAKWQRPQLLTAKPGGED